MILSSLLSTNAKPKEDMQASPRADYVPSYGYRSTANEMVTPDGMRAIATAYRAGNIISDAVANLPFQQMQRSGRRIEQVQPDPIARNPAYLLQVSPNIWGWTPYHFKKVSIDWLLYYGNNYIWSPSVGPRQMLILPANRTVPVFDLEGGLWYRHQFSNGQTAYIPAVEILHQIINPDQTGFMGRGVITFARETIGRQLAAYKAQSKQYAQGLLPAAYMQFEGDLSPDARKAVRAEYETAMSGSENAYRLAVLDRKITKFEPISMQNRDAQFLESIGANNEDIANFFGLPLHMLNMGKEAYNSNEQKYIEYLQGTLDAYLVPWEEGARIRWLTRAEQADTYFKFIREALLRMSARDRAEKNEIQIRSGQLTPNEAREKDDASAYEGGDQYYMAGNILPIGVKPNEQ